LIKIAVFGGSFDPPHKGHQQIVQKALERLDVDRLIILPAYLNPFKKSTLASPEQRLEWCRRLFGTLPDVEVSDFEIRMGRPVYTSESVRHFQKLYEVKYLVIGSDSLSSIDRWHEFEWLNRTLTWAVAEREAHPLRTEKLRDWIRLKIDIPASSTSIREDGKIEWVDERIRKDVANVLGIQTKYTKGIDI